MLGSGGLSDLNLYLSLIQEEITRIREEISELCGDHRVRSRGRDMKALLIAMEDNYDQLARITGRR